MAPGSGLAEPFTRNIESLAHNSHLSMLAIFGVFALVHSGGAYLRPYGESLLFLFLAGPMSKFLNVHVAAESKMQGSVGFSVLHGPGA